MKIAESFSTYLDGLRIFSAVFVVLFHIKKLQLVPPEIARFIPNHGHDFVMVFFVLSGYLIAYSTDRKSSGGFKEYFLDRASRIYSVAIPVLFICLALSFFHEHLDPERYFATAIDSPVLTFVSNFIFFSHYWGEAYLLFWNQPYWSLSYEVVYYVIFGCYVFIRAWKVRWMIIFLLALAIGPKVLLLFPCWLAGVFAYRYRDAWKPSQEMAFVLGFIIPICLLVLLHEVRFGPMVRDFTNKLLGSNYESLLWSKDFLIDYVTAFLVALNLFAVRHIEFSSPRLISICVKGGADMSYSLYLVHQPILYMLLMIFGDSEVTSKVFIFVVVCTFLLCFEFARFTEEKRFWLRCVIAKLIGKLSISNRH